MSLGVGSKFKKNRFRFPRCLSSQREPAPDANRLRKRKGRVSGRLKARNGWVVNRARRLFDV